MRYSKLGSFVSALTFFGVLVAGNGPGNSARELDVQGHRGCRGLFPENSMAAFRKALDLGVTTLELDLQITKDRVLVVHHDAHLGGHCVRDDGSKVPRTLLSSTTFAELEGIDCGGRVGGEFRDRQSAPAPIPRFEEVLVLARDAGYPVRLNVEIKRNDSESSVPLTEIARLLLERIGEYGLEQRTTVQSFSTDALAAVRDMAPEISRSVLVREPERYSAAVEEASASVLSPKYTALREEHVRRFQEQGIEVIPWTVNKPAAIRRMIELGVDGIISDYPDRVLDALSESASTSGTR